MAASEIEPPPTAERLLTPDEVGRYLGIPPSTLANWRYLRRGPAFLKVGRHVRYRTRDVDEWIDIQLAHN